MKINGAKKSVTIRGIAGKDRKTKNLIKRIGPKHIAFIDHEDVDRVSAEGLVSTGTKAVVNASSFSTGTYPNQGPGILLRAGIHLIEDIGESAFERIVEGEEVLIVDDKVYQGGKLVAVGNVLSEEELEKRLENARKNIDKELIAFAENTVEYIKKERKLLFEDLEIPKIKTNLKDKSCLVVVRGHDYQEDINALRIFIENEKPIIIAVDGAADLLFENRISPDIIIGDMDSVSEESLKKVRDVIVHSYIDGRAPGLSKALAARRAEDVKLFKFQGTSEDAALVLAYELGASLIVLVGSHTNLIDFLDKGRKGMASTFLTRLRVGDRLIDAKGVSKIYKSHAKPHHLFIFLLVILALFILTISLSSPAKNLISMLIFKLQILLASI
ncbi:MAG: putative cytokinetic ring protein SteA [Actinobacteria bacterium]|nr:putative cytokinetic ring protein SteA [Actinomycetota bacterium]